MRERLPRPTPQPRRSRACPAARNAVLNRHGTAEAAPVEHRLIKLAKDWLSFEREADGLTVTIREAIPVLHGTRRRHTFDESPIVSSRRTGIGSSHARPQRQRAHPIDVQVGRRLGELRRARSLSQSELGRAVGVSFQQLQKYEAGANRISASRLFDIAKHLDVAVGDFFPSKEALRLEPPISPQAAQVIREAGRLVPRHQKLVLDLIRILMGNRD